MTVPTQRSLFDSPPSHADPHPAAAADPFAVEPVAMADVPPAPAKKPRRKHAKKGSEPQQNPPATDGVIRVNVASCGTLEVLIDLSCGTLDGPAIQAKAIGRFGNWHVPRVDNSYPSLLSIAEDVSRAIGCEVEVIGNTTDKDGNPEFALCRKQSSTPDVPPAQPPSSAACAYSTVPLTGEPIASLGVTVAELDDGYAGHALSWETPAVRPFRIAGRLWVAVRREDRFVSIEPKPPAGEPQTTLERCWWIRPLYLAVAACPVVLRRKPDDNHPADDPYVGRVVKGLAKHEYAVGGKSEERCLL